MIQSFKDEYKVTNKKRSTSAEPVSVLFKLDESRKVNVEMHTYYRSGLGKLLHIVSWSRQTTAQ